MDKIEALYQSLNEAGYYTKSLEDFKGQFSDEESQSKLYSKLNDAGYYTKTQDDFVSQFFTGQEVKKKDSSSSITSGVMDSQSGLDDANVASFLAENPNLSEDDKLDFLKGSHQEGRGVNPEELSSLLGEQVELQETIEKQLKARGINRNPLAKADTELTNRLDEINQYLEGNEEALELADTDYQTELYNYAKENYAPSEFNQAISDWGIDQRKVRTGLVELDGEKLSYNEAINALYDDDLIVRLQEEKENGLESSFKIDPKFQESEAGKFLKSNLDQQVESGHRVFDLLDASAAAVAGWTKHAGYLEMKAGELLGSDYLKAMGGLKYKGSKQSVEHFEGKIRLSEYEGAVQAAADGNWTEAFALTGNQLASTATDMVIAGLTGGGPAVLGIHSGLSKVEHLDDMKKSGELDISEANMWAAGLASGVAEYYFEKHTFKMFDEMAGAFKGTRDITTARTFVDEFIKPILPRGHKEGVTEFYTEGTNMLVDRFMGIPGPDTFQDAGLQLANSYWGGFSMMGAGGTASASAKGFSNLKRRLFAEEGNVDITVFQNGEKVNTMTFQEFNNFLSKEDNLEEWAKNKITVDVSPTAKGREVMAKMEAMSNKETVAASKVLIDNNVKLGGLIKNLKELKDGQDPSQIIGEMTETVNQSVKIQNENNGLDIGGATKATIDQTKAVLNKLGYTIHDNVNSQSLDGAEVTESSYGTSIETEAEAKHIESQLEEGAETITLVKSQDNVGHTNSKGETVSSKVTTEVFPASKARLALSRFQAKNKSLTGSKLSIANFSKNNTLMKGLKESDLGEIDMGKVKKGEFHTLTASRDGLSPELNEKRNANLKEILDGMEGVEYTEVDGVWEGNSEKSLLITGLTPQQAQSLGNQFNQDAIFSGKDGLLYQDGTVEAIETSIMTGNQALEQSGLTIAKDKKTGKAIAFSFGLGKSKYGDSITESNIDELSDIESKYDKARANIVGQIASIMNLGTGIKFKVFRNSNALASEVQSVMGKSAEESAQIAQNNAFYRGEDGFIYINMENVQGNTLFHEISHPLVDFIKTQESETYKKIEKAVKESKSVHKVILNKKTGLAEKVSYLDWAKNEYPNDSESAQIEEAFAEMMGDAAYGKWKYDNSALGYIHDLLRDVWKAIAPNRMIKDNPTEINLKDIVDLGTLRKDLSDAFVGGKKIKMGGTEFNIKPKDSELRFQPNYIDPNTGLQFTYLKNQEQFDDLVEQGFITQDKTLSDFNGKVVVAHSPDAMFSGSIIDADGTILVEGKGGVMYPMVYHEDGRFWASTKGKGEAMANLLNSTIETNDGKVYLALVTAPPAKLMSASATSRGLVNLFTSDNVIKKLGLKKSDIFKALATASKYTKNGESLGLKLKTSVSQENFKDTEVSKLYEALSADNSSFDQRRTFLDKFIIEIKSSLDKDKSKSNIIELIAPGLEDADVDKFKGTNVGSIKKALVYLLTEPSLRKEAPKDSVYAIIEASGKLKSMKDDSYESYPEGVETEDKSKVTIHLLKDREAWHDNTKFEGEVGPAGNRIAMLPDAAVSEKEGLSSSNKVGPLKDIVLPKTAGISKPLIVDTDIIRAQVYDSWNGGQNLFGRFKTLVGKSTLEKNIGVTEPVGTEGFKAWFGDSVFKDMNGNPVPMYHGTNSEVLFDSFNTRDGLHHGAFFTPDTEFAENFNYGSENMDGTMKPSRTIPVYLKVERPFDYSNEATWDLAIDAGVFDLKALNKIKTQAEEVGVNWALIEQKMEELEVIGYDGVFVAEGGVKNIAVFKPENVRSIFRQDFTDTEDIKFQKPMDKPLSLSHLKTLKSSFSKRDNEGFVYDSIDILINYIEGNIDEVDSYMEVLVDDFENGELTLNHFTKEIINSEFNHWNPLVKGKTIDTKEEVRDYLSGLKGLKDLFTDTDDIKFQAPEVEDVVWENSLTGKGDPSIVKRNESVRNAAEEYGQGDITFEEYLDIQEKNSPIQPITRFFTPASEARMRNDLSGTAKGRAEDFIARGKTKIDKSDLVNAPIKDAELVSLRLDIPAYVNKNSWIVSIHDGSKKNGDIWSYQNVARINNVRFETNPMAALAIATGKASKTTIARMFGEWVPFDGLNSEDKGASAMKFVEGIVNNPDWIQVGMNPFRHSYFYDRTDGQPVVSADEVIQVGGLVYAKNAVKTSPYDDKFTVKSPAFPGAIRFQKNQDSVEPGKRLFNDPNPETAIIAKDYISNNNLPSYDPIHINKLDQSKSKRIADLYVAMTHNPLNEKVKSSYSDLADEVVEQYKAISDNGYTLELFEGEGEPYKNSFEMIKDVVDNKRMIIFGTESGYGEGGISEQERSENPMLRSTEFKDLKGNPLLVNDLFRFVHDFFGHTELGNGFGPIGEENAWVVHSRMFSDNARRALTTETRGQNSWVNFGPHMRRDDGSIPKRGDKDYTPLSQRPFASQKIGLLPDELVFDIPSERTLRFQKNDNGQVTLPQDKLDKLKSVYSDIQDKHDITIKDGMVSLYHFSSEERTSIDPALAKMNVYSKDEYRTWGRPRVFFYTDKESKESVMVNNVLNEAVLPIDRIYPLSEDPLDLQEIASENINKLKESGNIADSNISFKGLDYDATNLSISLILSKLKDAGVSDMVSIGSLKEGYIYDVNTEATTPSLDLSVRYPESIEDIVNPILESGSTKLSGSRLDPSTTNPKTGRVYNLFEETAKVAEGMGFVGFMYDHVGGKTVTSWEAVNVTTDRFQVNRPDETTVYHSGLLSIAFDISQLLLRADYYLGNKATGAKIISNMAYDVRLTKLLFLAEGAHSDKLIKQKFVESKGEVEMHINEAERGIKRLQKAVKKAGYDHTTINDYLRGFDDSGAIMNPTEILDKDVREAVLRARRHMDHLSKTLIDNGLVHGEMAYTISSNLGVYMTRSYKSHENKGWKQTDREIIDRAREFLREELLKLDPTLEGEFLRSRVEGELNSIIDGKDSKILKVYGFGNSVGKVNSIFKERTDVPVEIRDLLGEITEPYANYINTIGKISKTVASERLFKNLKEAGLATDFKLDDSHFELEGTKWGGIEGKHVDAEMFAVLNEAFGESQINNFLMRALMTVITWAKKAKTIYSIPTHARNIVGNVSFAIMNGHWRAGKMIEAGKVTIESLKNINDNDMMELYSYLIEEGVVSSSTSVQEIRGMVNDLSKKDYSGPRLTDSRLSKLAQSIDSGVTSLYQAEDDIWKIFGFLNERSRYMKAGLTESQASKVAAKNIRNLYPNYSEIPNIVRIAGRSPLIGTFVAFNAEVVRNSVNAVRTAQEEMSSGNAQIKKIGITRMAGILTNFVVMEAAYRSLAEIAFGFFAPDSDGEEEEETLDKMTRELLAPWDINGNLIIKDRGRLGSREVDGQRSEDAFVEYINTSSIDGTGYLKNILRIAWNGLDTTEGQGAANNLIKSFLGPYLSPEMTTSVLKEVWDNDGERAFNPTDSWAKQLYSIIGYVGEKLGPGTLTQSIRIYEATTGKSERELVYELIALGGLRINKVNVNKSFKFKAIEAIKNIKNRAESLGSTHHDIRELVKVDSQINSYLNDLSDKMMAAWMQGVSENDLGAIMNHVGIQSNVYEIAFQRMNERYHEKQTKTMRQ